MIDEHEDLGVGDPPVAQAVDCEDDVVEVPRLVRARDEHPERVRRRDRMHLPHSSRRSLH
jgi:hypothetical protein